MEIASIIEGFADVPGGLMPALHALQHELGHVPAAAIAPLARLFNLSEAEVHGVATFYKDFRSAPATAPIVQVCRAEACQARGCAPVLAAARSMEAAGTIEVEEVFCLGNCALGPSVRVGDRVHGRVQPGELAAIANWMSDSSNVELSDIQFRRVFVPGDTAAVSVGADDVAAAFVTAGFDVVRTGSRGMLWLEPLVEVDTAQGRLGFGPVHRGDVDSLAAAVASGADHPRSLGLVEQLPWMVQQRRVTFRRVGIVDPRSTSDYEANGGLAGLRRALAMTPGDVVAEVTASGLRGRGGAAFPTGIKWQTVLDTSAEQKYVCCNADEGDSGTFADRMLIEGDPFTLIEGMTIAGLAVGATVGYVYVRSEYPAAIDALQRAIVAARVAGWLGRHVLGSDVEFDVHVRVGAGAYICGEETAMLESLEGRRGMVRAKPPLPAHHGLFGKPTVINNVLTLATVPMILADGAAAYQALGSGRSRGTQVFQLAGNIARGGIVEVPFGLALSDLIERFGGGTGNGRPIRAAQVGGPLGAYLAPSQFDLAMDYEVFAAADALVGHGGVVVFDDTADMAAQARFAMEFCAIESCGKCTPCRIGSTRGVEVIDRIIAGEDRDENLVLLADLCEVMADGSLCAMGGLTPLPVRSVLTHFAEDFERPNDQPNENLGARA